LFPARPGIYLSHFRHPAFRATGKFEFESRQLQGALSIDRSQRSLYARLGNQEHMFTLQHNNATFNDKARARERIIDIRYTILSDIIFRDAPLTARDTNALKLPPFRYSHHTYECIRVTDYCFLHGWYIDSRINGLQHARSINQ